MQLINNEKETLFISFVVLICLAFASCDNVDNPVENPEANETYDFSKAIGITWRLYGFGTVGEDKVEKTKPEKGDEGWFDGLYTIIFKDDGTLWGKDYLNEFRGVYIIDGNTLVFDEMRTTLVGEYFPDEEKYYAAPCSPYTHPFKIKNGQLLLYYNDGKDYLLFYKLNTK